MMKRESSSDGPLPVEVSRVLAELKSAIPDSLVAVYLFGSYCDGGLRPQSDIDIFVAVSRPIIGAERESLVAQLLKVSGRDAIVGPSRPLEVTIVVVSEVVPWRFPPTCDLLFGEWLRGEFLAGRIPPAAPRPDLAIVMTTLMQRNQVLLGPAAPALFGAIPIADLRLAIAACLPSLLDGLEGDERNVILTLARMWLTLATGTILPKDGAASWVLDRLPANLSAILELARSAYLGERRDDWSTLGPEVGAFVQHSVSEIRALL